MPFRTSIQIILAALAILVAILCILYYFGSKDIVLEKTKIIEKIPLKYIASFIGVKPETLSRIRKKNNNI